MAVQLGSGMKAPETAGSSDAFVRAIAGEVMAQLQSRLAELDRRIAQVVNTKQPVHVAPSTASVQVAAPNVTMTPTIQVDVPDIELPEMTMTCTVEMPGVDRLADLLERIVGVLEQPVERTVQRDHGVITSVTERRV